MEMVKRFECKKQNKKNKIQQKQDISRPPPPPVQKCTL